MCAVSILKQSLQIVEIASGQLLAQSIRVIGWHDAQSLRFIRAERGNDVRVTVFLFV